jgi:hypothetical protein
VGGKMSDKQIYFVLNEQEMTLIDDALVMALHAAEKNDLPRITQQLKQLMYKLRAHVSSVRDGDENDIIKVRMK